MTPKDIKKVGEILEKNDDYLVCSEHCDGETFVFFKRDWTSSPLTSCPLCSLEEKLEKIENEENS